MWLKAHLVKDGRGDAPKEYRGTSLIRNNPSLGLYSRLMPRALWWSYGAAGGSCERRTCEGAF